MRKLNLMSIMIVALLFTIQVFAQSAWTKNMSKGNPVEGQVWTFAGNCDSTLTLTSATIDLSQYDALFSTYPLQFVIVMDSDETIKVGCIVYVSGDNSTWLAADTIMTADSVQTAITKTISLNINAPFMRLAFKGATGNVDTDISGYIYARKEDD